MRKKVKNLSKGMQQKAQIIGAILHDPKLIVVDEPFSGLDPVNTEAVKEVMCELRDRGATILMSTHQMRQVEELCDRILLIDHGRSLLYGNLDEVRKSYSGNEVLLKTEGEISGIQGVEKVTSCNGAFKLTLDGDTTPQTVLKQLAARDVVVEKFEIAIPSVSEIFVRLVDSGGV